jgi:pyridoxal phosphate enzyme (YggS family)
VEPAARSNKLVIAGFLWNWQRPVRLSRAEFFREEAGGGPAAPAAYRHFVFEPSDLACPSPALLAGLYCLRELARAFTQPGMSESADIAAGLATVQADIAAACREANRNPSEVTLIAVSKTFPAQSIEQAIASGQRVFGENRVQETKAKWPDIRARHQGLSLHLIGPLQSNKAKEAVALFDAIHSLDRASLCEALSKEIVKQGRAPLLFAEINTGAEPQKAGILPEDADAFLRACKENYGLTVAGLMCIPPFDEAPAPHFALTAKIAARNDLKLLSMGMSADYRIAIAFGATHVRIGSAIFGERPKV